MSDERRCIHGRGRVVFDDRKPTPYVIDGCMVGEKVVSRGVTYLRGFGFVTLVLDAVEEWPRKDAPDPCPHCVAAAARDAAAANPPDQPAS